MLDLHDISLVSESVGCRTYCIAQACSQFDLGHRPYAIAIPHQAEQPFAAMLVIYGLVFVATECRRCQVDVIALPIRLSRLANVIEAYD